MISAGLILALALAGPGQVMAEGTPPSPAAGPAEAGGITAEVPDLSLGMHLELCVAGGELVQGAFTGADGGEIELSTQEGLKRFPVLLVDQVKVGDRWWSTEAFMGGVEAWAHRYLEARPATPSPALVAGLSVISPGLGPLALGETSDFCAWTAADLVLLGAAGLMIYERQYSQLLPLGALMTLARAWAAGDSWREARRRGRVQVLVRASPGAAGVVLAVGAHPPIPDWQGDIDGAGSGYLTRPLTSGSMFP